MVPQRKLDWALERSAADASRRVGENADGRGGATFNFIYNGTAATREEAENFGRWSFDSWMQAKEQYDRRAGLAF
jgi:hypothetical protein